MFEYLIHHRVLNLPRTLRRSARVSLAATLLVVLPTLGIGQIRSGADADNVKGPGAGVASKELQTGGLSSAVGPILVSGNPTCAQLNASADPAFAHMTEDWEMKIDLSAPSGVFYMVDGGGVVLDGGLAPNANLFLSVASSGSTLSSWAIGPLNLLDRAVSAIIVKGGSNANVYTYPFLSVGDSGPFVTPQNREISHLTFCFEPFSGPSSAEVTLSGRAVTTGGVGVSGARVDVMNLVTGKITRATTNSFGYYVVEGLVAAEIYMVTISHRRHQFFDPQRTITIDDDIVGLDFVAVW
ncbi:MAG TPA: carboxypeptidase-like regulatory domain-containing protein [Pyrinomonadaceae bacterium]|nr:carboxypeptidase-like regulatory domain-containing protein [Pyrinomonadaceae bacterium]HMP66171.1 carboxypeptidase-like regulatory domain-containing protein [Pyrinomonadaceae bacterium]